MDSHWQSNSRQSRTSAEIRLIALSGYSQPPDSASGEGFDHYLVKPVDVDQLLSLLQRLP